MNPYLDAISILNSTNVPYVVIGGFAVVMHGSNRFTPDMNVLIDLKEPASLQVLTAFQERGFRLEPSPERLETILTTGFRNEWLEQGNHHLVLYEPDIEMFTVQFFLDLPIPFEELRERSVILPLREERVTVCSLEDLKLLKSTAGRAQDLMDLDNLNVLEQLRALDESELLSGDYQLNLPEGFPEARVADLMHFRSLSYAERADWLRDMLAGLGAFCFF